MDGLLDFLHNLLPTTWFESAKEHFGQELTDDVVAQSVHEASQFFGMDDPAKVHEDWTTGVMTNMSWTEDDDVLIFSRDQMTEMGITDKEGFDLVMTHEGAHRMLQGMQSQTHFNSHQEELCCDYMAGVRAGLNGMDEGKMQASLEDVKESDSHPDGEARVESIENGVKFAHDFDAKYGHAPTFYDCLESYEKTAVFSDASTHGLTTLSPEEDSSTMHGLTEGERQNHISKAKQEIAEAESKIRYNTSMISSKAAMNEGHSCEDSNLRAAKDQLAKAHRALNEAYNEHPDVKGFADYADNSNDVAIQSALDRVEDAIARAEVLVAENDLDLGIDTSHIGEDGNTNGEVPEDESTLKGMFVDGKEWNSSQAKWYQDKAKVEQHAADLAQEKGDYASMREHNRLAVSYQKMADQYAKDAKASTK